MADWNTALNEARNEFPDPFSDPRRTQKGRGGKNKSGWIEPSTKESAAACDKYLSDMYADITKQHAVNENIHNHQQNKARRNNRTQNDAIVNHAAESSRRMAKYSRTQSDPRGAIITIVVMLVTFACLGSVLAAYIP